jgi:hypothetical protein
MTMLIVVKGQNFGKVGRGLQQVAYQLFLVCVYAPFLNSDFAIVVIDALVQSLESWHLVDLLVLSHS